MNKLKRISLFLFVGAASMTALYYGALISVPYVVDLNKYKNTVATEIEKQTGFKVSCENISFKKSLTPYFKINLYHTIVLYPDNEVFLKLKEADLKVKILPLLFKKIIIKDAKFSRPIINITLYKDFSTSLEKYLKLDKTVDTNGFKLDGVIVDTICDRYKLKIKDESIDKTFYLEGDNLIIKDLKLNEKVHLILKGSLFEDKKEYLIYDLDLYSFIGKTEKQFSFSPFKQILDYDVHGNIKGNLEILKGNHFKGFLNLNDFSMKVEDTLLKNNSANLTFKGEEVEIDASLHTSLKDEAKVKGKINYGKKKQVDLTTNAKNIDLEKLYKVVSVIVESLNIPNKLSGLKIKGVANADFSINSDFKKLKSKGSAEIKNAEIFYNDLPYKINNINSIVNFDDNKINIEKAQAYVNSTPVNISGVINEDMTTKISVSSDNLDLKTITDLFLKQYKLPFEFMRGKLSFNSTVTGKFDKDLTLNTNVIINDFSGIEKNQKLPISVKNIDLKILNEKNKYSGEVTCSNFSTIFNKTPILSKTLKISFDEKNIKLNQSAINIIDSPVMIEGNIKDYIDNPVGQFSFAGDIDSENIAKIVSLYVNQPYKALGSINTTGSISLVKDDIKIKANLKADKDNYLSYLVIKELLNKPSVLKVDANINKKNITLKDITLTQSLNEKTEPTVKVVGQIINDKEPVFKNLRIQVPEYISASMNFFGGEDISLNADITVNNTLKNPELKGSANIQNYNIKKLYASVKNADVSFAKDNIRIIAPEVLVNTSKFNIMADIVPKISDVITCSNVQVNSLNLDLNTLFEMIEKERNPFASTILTIKKGSATINDFKVLALKARDISTDFTLKDNVLKLENIAASAYNGSVSGDMDYDFNHAKLQINMIGKGLDVKDSLYDLCKIEDNLAGKMDFTTSVAMHTGDYEQVIKSLSGQVVFDAVNGKMGTLGKFEYYLYAQNLLYHGLLNATLNRIADAISPNNTAKFKSAKGSLFLQNGYLIAEEIKTVGANMSLYVKGRHNLLTNQANIDIYGRISDEITSKLGSFGDVSISELLNGKAAKKDVSVMVIPNSVMKNIPDLYNGQNLKTNTFKVNIYGKIDSVGSINSFMWTMPDLMKEEELPEFSDL